MSKKKKKKQAENTLTVKLFQPDVNVKRWISYDIPDLKIEVMLIENAWIASATPEDEYNYFYGYDLTEVAYSRLVALTALLSQPGLPVVMGITKDFRFTVYEFHPNIEFHWKNHSTNQFEIEAMLPHRQLLDITFHQRSDGSWIWRNSLCIIEVMQIGSTWIASCDPRLRKGETVNRPKITIEDSDRDKVVALLLEDGKISLTLGLSYDEEIPLANLFDMIRVGWKEQNHRQVSKPAKPQKRRSQKQNKCPWRNNTRLCDDSFDCAFCGSSGEAYFMRWDD